MTDPTTGGAIGPEIREGALFVTVSYGGGCEEHEFDLHSRSSSDDATLWLEHDSNNDMCEAYLTEELEISLPDDVLGADEVRMLDPTGGSIVVARDK